MTTPLRAVGGPRAVAAREEGKTLTAMNQRAIVTTGFVVSNAALATAIFILDLSPTAGETGEFTLARLEGENIVFILSHRHFDLDTSRPVPLDSELAEPMRRALSGESGSVVGLDYRGIGLPEENIDGPT